MCTRALGVSCIRNPLIVIEKSVGGSVFRSLVHLIILIEKALFCGVRIDFKALLNIWDTRKNIIWQWGWCNLWLLLLLASDWRSYKLCLC